jgi:glycosyltransferase involved in cell wall biosynthesis
MTSPPGPVPTSAAALPRISVVIPSFNQGEFIEQCLLSVLGQHYPDLEILLIDGGSTDCTLEVLRPYQDGLSYWHSRPDRGQADAINYGMQRSSGAVLCWLNSDDMFLPGALLDIGRRLSGRTIEKVVVYGGTVTIRQGPIALSAGHQGGGRFDFETLRHQNFIPQPSSFWTRPVWDAAGELQLDLHYTLDWEWFLRASAVASFEPVNRFYSVYRYHEGHKSGRGGATRRKEILAVLRRYAPPRWVRLYAEVDQRYDSIRWVSSLLSRTRIPWAQRLVPLFFPRLLFVPKGRDDIGTVMAVLG